MPVHPTVRDEAAHACVLDEHRVHGRLEIGDEDNQPYRFVDETRSIVHGLPRQASAPVAGIAFEHSESVKPTGRRGSLSFNSGKSENVLRTVRKASDRVIECSGLDRQPRANFCRPETRTIRRHVLSMPSSGSPEGNAASVLASDQKSICSKFVKSLELCSTVTVIVSGKLIMSAF